MARAAVYLGWGAAEALATNESMEMSIVVAAATKRAQELIWELQDRLAREIRNQIAEMMSGKRKS